MFAFQDWEANRALRYQTFHSHPEARPNRPSAKKYKPPEALTDSIHNLSDKRIQRMLDGYFLDMYFMSLRSCPCLSRRCEGRVRRGECTIRWYGYPC